MPIEVFFRYEKKYRMSEDTCRRVQALLSEYMEPDIFNRDSETYLIRNVYYDTADSALIRRSLEKPFYKEKLRLRAYGTPEPDGMVYAEIKKKFNGIVSKRRSALTRWEACGFFASGELPQPQLHMNMQVLREVQAVLRRQPLQPMLYLSYRRRAYCGIEDPRLRISFDSHILSRRTDLDLSAGDYGAPLLPAGQYIMEIKTPESMPLWLTHLLAQEQIYPCSLSKYGMEAKRSNAAKLHSKPAKLTEKEVV